MDSIRLLDQLTPESMRKRRFAHSALRALWSLDVSHRQPGFLIIGAQKAGTTFLHNVIGLHPGVRRPATKEVAFYTYNYRRGLRWYRSHFAKCGEGQMSFESTADYLFHPLVPERIAATFPEVKLIICLREPVSRAVSHYGHSVAKGFESLDFRSAILQEEDRTRAEYERLADNPDYQARSLMRYAYAAKGRYVEQIRRYEQFFPREQMLFLDSKEIFSDTNRALAKAERFLALQPWEPANSVPAKNVGKKAEVLDPEALDFLRESFQQPNAELFEHLGWEPKW